MTSYRADQMQHWETQHIYQLDISATLPFLQFFIEALPNGALISFEGEFAPLPKPAQATDLAQTQHLRLNTLAPPLDFWIFQIDTTVRDFLTLDLIPTLAAEDAILHLLVEVQGKLLFSAHDQFHPESVHLATHATIPDDFLYNLQSAGTLSHYHKLTLH